MAWKIY